MGYAAASSWASWHTSTCEMFALVKQKATEYHASSCIGNLLCRVHSALCALGEQHLDT